ncbi:MAG: xanthine dehydrogenase family protein molybdopterin-binding subunit [Ferrimicrobium sp.]
MPGSILGTSVVRVEDPALLTGAGTYVDTMLPEGTAHLVFVRSPYAHAKVLTVDVSDAAQAPGVLGVFTAQTLGLPPFHGFAALNKDVPRPPLASGVVQFVGDPVVAVVANTRVEALDAAELVAIDYEPIPAAVDMEYALTSHAPQLYEGVTRNIAAGYRDPADDDVLGDAEVIVRGRFENQRVAVVPMEGNAILVLPNAPASDRPWTVYISTQMPHAVADLLAGVFGIEASSIRVVAPHVGGAFGGKAGIVAEHAVAFALAGRLARPIKWVESRSENMVAMPQGRGQVQYAELGLRRDGTFVGLRCRMVGDGGAYGGFGGGLVLGPTRTMAQGVYRIPKVSYSAVAAFTNTSPVGAFRGAGRPEAAAFLERIIDMAADELDIDPVEIRRRNLIPADAFPVTTQVGTTYDSGDYQGALDKLLAVVDYPELRREQTRRREHGEVIQLGIGVSTYVEITAGGGQNEYSRVEVHPDGSATIDVGTSAHGQGHATSFAMIVADRLGIPLEQIKFRQSDTAIIPRGGGTGGSRSLQIGGSAVAGAAELVLDAAKKLAAHHLEAAEDDIVVAATGGLEVAGVPSAHLSWTQLADIAAQQDRSLFATFDFQQESATFPFGAHLSVVEVDTDTGKVTPIRHVAVDDCGRIVNPLIVNGQQHGGITQGIAQALWEEAVYDPDGNPLTATLAEYAMPSAAELPSFEIFNTETPTPYNELGAKGIGESGTIGSMPAVQNAVVDALSYLGVRHIDMPCTPERVWRAIASADVPSKQQDWAEPGDVFAILPIRGTSSSSDAEAVDI